MRKSIIAFAVLALSGSALAANNTITFMGQVNDQTCVINVEGQVNPTITLETVSTASLMTPNSTSGLKVFNVNISGCTAPKVGVALVPNSINLEGGNLKNIAQNGASSNVALQLLDGANPIDLTQGIYSVLRNKNGSGMFNQTIPFGVQYISTAGGATPGNVEGAIEYTITYQ